MSKTPLGVGPYIFGEARYAAQDIRQKVFEEAWFGRVVTAEPVIEVEKSRNMERSDRSMLEETWGKAWHESEPRPEQEIEGPEIDR